MRRLCGVLRISGDSQLHPKVLPSEHVVLQQVVKIGAADDAGRE